MCLTTYLLDYSDLKSVQPIKPQPKHVIIIKLEILVLQLNVNFVLIYLYMGFTIMCGFWFN